MHKMSYDDIIDAQNTLVENWGEDGQRVIATSIHERPFNNSFTKFLSICDACGGNWGGMLLTGIKDLFPSVYDAIPENMGKRAFSCLCAILVLCGVDTVN